MPNKISYKQKRKAQQAQLQRLLIIGGIFLVAIAAVVFLILQNQTGQSTAAVGTIVPAPTQTWPQANGKTLGPADAKVVVSEFADFQCPYCKEFHDKIIPQIISNYVATGKVRFEYHHFIVIDGNIGGTESRHAAEASECANAQGKFWDYFSLEFANQGQEGGGAYSDSRLKAFAATVGLDTAKFNTCFDSHQFAQKVVADEQLANAHQLNSTPSLLVNNVLVQNPMDFTAVQVAIEAALKQAGQ
jgi:protein-disulfide isomerase